MFLQYTELPPTAIEGDIGYTEKVAGPTRHPFTMAFTVYVVGVFGVTFCMAPDILPGNQVNVGVEPGGATVALIAAGGPPAQ